MTGLLLLMRHLVANTDAAFEEGSPLKRLVFMAVEETAAVVPE